MNPFTGNSASFNVPHPSYRHPGYDQAHTCFGISSRWASYGVMNERAWAENKRHLFMNGEGVTERQRFYSGFTGQEGRNPHPSFGSRRDTGYHPYYPYTRPLRRPAWCGLDQDPLSHQSSWLPYRHYRSAESLRPPQTPWQPDSPEDCCCDYSRYHDTPFPDIFTGSDSPNPYTGHTCSCHHHIDEDNVTSANEPAFASNISLPWISRRAETSPGFEEETSERNSMPDAPLRNGGQVPINQNEGNHAPTQGPLPGLGHPVSRDYASRTTIDEHFGTNEHPADMNEDGDIRMEFPPEYKDNGADIPQYNYTEADVSPTEPQLPDLATQRKELEARERRLREEQHTFRATVQQEEQCLNTKKSKLEDERRRFNAEKEMFKHEQQRLCREKEELELHAREIIMQETRLHEEKIAFGHEKRRFAQERSWQGRSFRYRRRARPVRPCWDPDCSGCETGSGLSDDDTDMPDDDFMGGSPSTGYPSGHRRARRSRGSPEVDGHEAAQKAFQSYETAWTHLKAHPTSSKIHYPTPTGSALDLLNPHTPYLRPIQLLYPYPLSQDDIIKYNTLGFFLRAFNIPLSYHPGPGFSPAPTAKVAIQLDLDSVDAAVVRRLRDHLHRREVLRWHSDQFDKRVGVDSVVGGQDGYGQDGKVVKEREVGRAVDEAVRGLKGDCEGFLKRGEERAFI